MEATAMSMSSKPTPLVDYARPVRSTWRLSLIEWLIIVGALALVASILLPSLGRRRGDQVPRVHCASNMRSIGQALRMYANDHQGLFPPDLAHTSLTTEYGLNTSFLTYPWRAHEGRNAPFIYFGKGRTTKDVSDTILLVEFPDDHGRSIAGSNVLYLDGHVEWIDQAQAEWIITELAVSRNPPPDRGPVTKGHGEGKSLRRCHAWGCLAYSLLDG
jgi:prepilin-type processing-associated H-X9-DG protein